MPPRGSKIQKSKQTSEQQSNNQNQKSDSDHNQKSDSEIQFNKSSSDLILEETPQQSEVQKHTDASATRSQHNNNSDILLNDDKSKDFIDAKKKVREMSIENLAKLISDIDLNQIPAKTIQSFHLFYPSIDDNDIAAVINILNYVNECLPFFRYCKYFPETIVKSFINDIQKLLNFNGGDDFFQNYFQKISSFCSDYDNLFRNQYNFKLFQNMFRENFSKLNLLLYDSVQNIIKNNKLTLYYSDYQKVYESLTVLYIGFKILTKAQRIRTISSFIEKAASVKSTFYQFLYTTDLMTSEIKKAISEKINGLIKSVLYLKMICMVQQFLDIFVDISQKVENKDRLQIENNEIIEFAQSQLSQTAIGYQILDEFSFDINEKTEFLKMANQFKNQLNKDTEIEDFKSLIGQFIEKSNFCQCGLNQIIFSLHYHYRMMQISVSSMISLMKSEPQDQVAYLRKIYVAFRILLKRYSSLEGQSIGLGIINDLTFTLRMKIKKVCSEISLKRSYKGTAAFQNTFKYMKLFMKDLKTIENTICFAHQLDLFMRELQINSNESGLILNCLFYSPSDVDLSGGYDAAKVPQSPAKQGDSYDQIIDELAFELRSHGYNLLPKNYSKNDCEILAPNLSHAINVMLNYGDSPQVQKLLESPNCLCNEEKLFSLINEIYLKVIDNPESSLQLKDSIFAYVTTFYLLKSLSLIGKIDLSNSIYLMYFRSYASILFNDEFIGKVSLVSPFEIRSHPCYQSILKKLTGLMEYKQINDEISHIRLYFYKFAENLFHLDPSIISENLSVFHSILRWFSNPSKESNDKFLSCKYLAKVKKLFESFTKIISDAKQNIKKNKKKVMQNLREIQSILNSIINLQTHYLQFRKSELIIPYLRSFLKCQEEDKKFCQFISFFPVWYNSIHRCFNYNLIELDENLLSNSFKSKPSNIVSNCERLINSFNVNYMNFFNELIASTLKLSNQNICMMIDVIVRGSFSFENIAKLLRYVLQYFLSFTSIELINTFSDPKMIKQSIKYLPFQSPGSFELWQQVIKLSCLLIALNTHPYLQKQLNINLLRIINLKNYVNSYVNGFLYLISSPIFPSIPNNIKSNIHLKFKELTKLSSDIPINIKIRNTYEYINEIINIVNLFNKYLCENSPEEGISDYVENFIGNIQDKKIRKAFKSSLKVALLSGSNSQGSTILLSKIPTGMPIVAAQSCISGGYGSIFYDNEEDNYLNDLNSVLNEYLDSKEHDEFDSLIKENNDTYCNINYFDEWKDTNVNVISKTLSNDLINECFRSDDIKQVENCVKVIDAINILTLYLSLMKESNSFNKFATFEFAPFVRIVPPFAICKPNDFERFSTPPEKSASAKNNDTENVMSEHFVNNDWLKVDFNSFISNNFEASSKSRVKSKNKQRYQIQIQPIQYVLGDIGLSSSECKLKMYYNTASQALKRQIPTPMFHGDSNFDQVFPIEIQQSLIDQINETKKEMNPKYLQELREKRSEEQREMQEMLRQQQAMKENKEMKDDDNETKKSHSKSRSKGHSKVPKAGEEEDDIDSSIGLSKESSSDDDSAKLIDASDSQISKEEEDKIDDVNEFDSPDHQKEVLETRRPGRPRTRGRGRGMRKARGRGARSRKLDRTSSVQMNDGSFGSSSMGIQISNASSLQQVMIAPQIPVKATDKLSLMKRMMSRLDLKEKEEARCIELKENISRFQPVWTSTVSQIENNLKELKNTSNDVIHKKTNYYDALMKSKEYSADCALKKEQYNQSKNVNNGLNFSNSIAQKAIDSLSKNEDENRKSGNEKISIGFNSFNPFNLDVESNDDDEINVTEELSNSPTNADVESNESKDVQNEEFEMSPNELFLLHQTQISNIIKNQVKSTQKIENEDEKSIQSKLKNTIDIENENDEIQSQIAQEKIDDFDENGNENGSKINVDVQIQPQEQQDDNDGFDDDQSFNLKSFDVENSSFSTLPSSLKSFVSPRWAFDIIEENENEIDVVSDQIASEKVYDVHRKDISDTKKETFYNVNPSELQILFGLNKEKIRSYKKLANDLNDLRKND